MYKPIPHIKERHNLFKLHNIILKLSLLQTCFFQELIKCFLIFILMKIFSFIFLAASFASLQEKQAYIIHTEDNMLHFVTDHIESFKLDLNGICESSSSIRRQDIFIDANNEDKFDMHKNSQCINVLGTRQQAEMHSANGKEAPSNTFWDKSISIQTKLQNTNGGIVPGNSVKHMHSSIYNNTSEDSTESHGRRKSYTEIKRVSRLDKVIFKDGYLLVNSFKIYVEDLLLHPSIIDEIYISASQEQIPKMIKGDFSTYCKNSYTLLVMADIKIRLFDLYDYSSRTIQFSQILHLYDVFLKLEILEDENAKYRVFLNGKLWVFDKKIAAVYMLKEKNGINYMLKVCNDKSQLKPYNYRIRTHGNTKTVAITLSILCLSLVLWFYHSKNISYAKLLSKPESMYLGKFNKKDALIYHVDRDVLALNTKIYPEVKDGNLVNMFYEGFHMFSRVLVTEKTLQLNFEDKRLVSMRDGDKTFKSVVRDIARTIESFHQKNICHSRICPENLRIVYSSQNICHVRIQSIFNNLGWKSVGQIKDGPKQDEDSQVLRIQDDIFSLGCVIHYHLTGFHPFDLRDDVNNIKDPVVCVKDDLKSNILDNPVQNGVSSKDSNLDEQNNPDTKTSEVACQKPNNSPGKDNLGIHLVFLNLVKKKIEKVFARLFQTSMPTNNDREEYFKRILDKDSISHIEYNVIFNTYKLRIKEQVVHDLIYHCIKAPSASSKFLISQHPFFWNFPKITDFLCDASDFIETHPSIKSKLEKNKKKIFGNSWDQHVDPLILTDLCSRRNYDYKSLTDLIRLIRNCHRHFIELKNRDFFENFEGKVGEYFNDKFPELLMFLYRHSTFKDQKDFKRYYL